MRKMCCNVKCFVYRGRWLWFLKSRRHQWPSHRLSNGLVCDGFTLSSVCAAVSSYRGGGLLSLSRFILCKQSKRQSNHSVCLTPLHFNTRALIGCVIVLFVKMRLCVSDCGCSLEGFTWMNLYFLRYLEPRLEFVREKWRVSDWDLSADVSEVFKCLQKPVKTVKFPCKQFRFFISIPTYIHFKQLRWSVTCNMNVCAWTVMQLKKLRTTIQFLSYLLQHINWFRSGRIFLLYPNKDRFVLAPLCSN